MTHIVSGLYPGGNRILNICNRFLRGFPIAHASRQIRYRRQKPAPILEREGLDQNAIFQSIHDSDFTASINVTSCLIYTGLMGLLKGIVSLIAN
jgi:hypothetical protein